ncbi:MAG TPA: hypothetical protein VKA30_06665 [Actinomycetota bacterium]|nr:hypothetical protein [Actinomycetota bacterium]
MARPRRLVPGSLALVLLVACTGSSSPSNPPTATPLPASPSGSAAGPAPLVAALPSTCDEAVPASAATVTFTASGRAWAVGPDGTGLTCLFEVTDPGAFAWGPKADRVALGGLAVHGVGSGASRPAIGVVPEFLSWGRPTGKAVAFANGAKLEKAIVGSADVEDITPLEDVTYRDVVYHPSGLAIAFVVNGPEGSAIWLSSNTGEDPKRLVWSKSGTVFSSLAFNADGRYLFYGARAANGTRLLAELLLAEGRAHEGLWRGDRDVMAVLPRPAFEEDVPDLGSVLLNVGAGCADERALFTTLDGGEGTPILPDENAPTAALGWTGPSTVLVGVGGCGTRDLWTVSAIDGTPTLLVRGVDTAAVRVPDGTPPPPLPELGVKSDFA